MILKKTLAPRQDDDLNHFPDFSQRGHTCWILVSFATSPATHHSKENIEHSAYKLATLS